MPSRRNKVYIRYCAELFRPPGPPCRQAGSEVSTLRLNVAVNDVLILPRSTCIDRLTAAISSSSSSSGLHCSDWREKAITLQVTRPARHTRHLAVEHVLRHATCRPTPRPRHVVTAVRVCWWSIDHLATSRRAHYEQIVFHRRPCSDHHLKSLSALHVLYRPMHASGPPITTVVCTL